MTSTIVFAVFFTVVAVASLARYARPAWSAAAADRFARSVDLQLHPDVAPTVIRRLATRDCVAALLAVVGTWVAAAWWQGGGPPPEPDGANFGPLVVVLGSFGGHTLGYGAVAWWESARPTPAAGPRLARATTPRHGDYVPALERWGAWAAVAVAVVLTALLAVLDAATGTVDLGALPPGLLVALLVIPPVVLLLGELVAARLLQRGQVATTPLELAWDDALRARTLRDIATFSLVTAVYSPFLLLGVVGSTLEGGWPDNPAVGLVSGATGLLLLAGVVIAAVSAAQLPQRHFRTRLWSRTSPDDAGALAQGGGR